MQHDRTRNWDLALSLLWLLGEPGAVIVFVFGVIVLVFGLIYLAVRWIERRQGVPCDAGATAHD
jgi:hypothetical protein